MCSASLLEVPGRLSGQLPYSLYGLLCAAYLRVVCLAPLPDYERCACWRQGQPCDSLAWSL